MVASLLYDNYIRDRRHDGIRLDLGAAIQGLGGIPGLLFRAPLTGSLDLSKGTGPATFTRSSPQTYRNGIVGAPGFIKEELSSNTPVFETVNGSAFGVSLWQTSENLALHYGDMSNAVWVKSASMAVGTGSSSVIDGKDSSRLTASAANQTAIQDLGVISSAVKSYSLYIKRVTGTGNIEITLDGGSTWTDVKASLNSTTFTRVYITQTLADPDIGIRIVTSGDVIDVDGNQAEAVAFPTPVIPTTTTAVSRDNTVLSYPSAGNINIGTDDGSILANLLKSEESSAAGHFGKWFDFSTGNTRIQNTLTNTVADTTQTAVGTGSGVNTVSHTITPYPSTPKQIGITYGAHGTELFYNGAEVGTPSVTPTNIGADATMSLTVSGQELNGNMNDLRIYLRRLTEPEFESLA